MEQTAYIAIIGEYSSRLVDKTIREVLANSDAEINVFDFPAIGGKDGVERVQERVLVHQYACPSRDLTDSAGRAKEYIRDIVYLGAQKYYLCKPAEREYSPLYKSLESALKTYGVDFLIV